MPTSKKVKQAFEGEVCFSKDVLISNALKYACLQLENTSDSPSLDAELLLAHCLDKNRTYLHIWPDAPISAAQYAHFTRLIEKRLEDYPVAYLVGTKAFWTLDLMVTPDVLIPRPETELLVETALNKISAIKSPSILDLGTGSGAIALAIASERPDANITAVDYSQAALTVAEKNACENALSSQLTFIQSDWFENIPKDKPFDLIVSNPPYIDPKDPHLLGSIRHEPLQALVASNHGMDDIRLIIEKSADFLKNQSWILIEHGYDQAQATRDFFAQCGFSKTETLLDLNQHARLTMAKNNRNRK